MTLPIFLFRLFNQKKDGAMKYKILVVGSFRSKEFGVVGGIARSCEELLDSEFTKRFEILKLDSTQTSNPPPNIPVRVVPALARFFQLISLLIRHRPDGVLIFFSSGLSFYEKITMGWLAKFFKAKVFLFPRAGALIELSSRSKFVAFVHRGLFRCGDVFLAQGRTWIRYAIDFCKFRRENVYLVPNWTASKHFFALGKVKILTHEATTRPTILFVGWLEEEKGVRELLQACKMLAGDGLDFSCLLAGDGTQRQWAEEFIDRYGLDEKVTLQGWLSEKALLDSYRSANIFVLPSRAEGMPNSLIEGISAGLCPVATKVGMIPDFLTDRQEGLLVPPYSVNALYEALVTLIKVPELQIKYSKAAYKLSSQFEKTSVISKLSDILEDRISN